MTDSQPRQAIALFRYGLIAEFVQLPVGAKGLYARLREKAFLTTLQERDAAHWIGQDWELAKSRRKKRMPCVTM